MHRRILHFAAALLVVSGCAEPEPDTPRLRYAVEYPEIRYEQTEPDGRLGQLAATAGTRRLRLEHDGEHGFLESALAELGIDPDSQVLVFSQTSLQVRQIRPETPRAIYFNDETYVAWIPGAPTLELASFDPELGPVFYTMLQDPTEDGAMEREFGVCLRCHDTYGLSGGGVPRFLLGSGYIDTEGELVSHEAWILTDQGTPLRSRWGGWYVTGRHGDQVHLGNIIVEQPEDLQDLEALRVGNIDDLEGLLDTSIYLTPYSDIVALLVLEHQVEVQNLISRLRFEALGRPSADAAEAAAELDPHIDALLAAMLMAGEAPLTDQIEGSSGFAERFGSLGPFDSAGRSLRTLDLQTRLFRYPLSYLIYSEAFAALPTELRAGFYARLRAVLDGSGDSDSFGHLAAADRRDLAAILRETLPEVFELEAG